MLCTTVVHAEQFLLAAAIHAAGPAGVLARSPQSIDVLRVLRPLRIPTRLQVWRSLSGMLPLKPSWSTD